MKRKYNLALIYGGRGTEHQISVLSKRYVKTLINREKYEIIDCFIGKNGKFYVEGDIATPLISESALLVCGNKIHIDVALPVLHGDFGEDGIVQGLIELMNTPYVGCDATAGAVAFDKVLTKRLCESIGIKTVEYESFFGQGSEHARERCEKSLTYPMFIKPTRQGSSYGANVVNCKEQFTKYYDLACRYSDGKVLVERCLTDKRELECAYLAYSGEEYISDVGEVMSHGFYSFADKYTDGKTCVVTHADIPSAVRDKIRECVSALASVLNIRHLARFDFFLSDDELYLNEVNTMPGFTRTSLYPRLIEDMGIAPSDMLERLISDAISVHKR